MRTTARGRFASTLLALLLLLSSGAPAQTGGITAEEYRERREKLMTAIGPDAALIAFSARPMRRTGDVDWPFRQEDNLLYLTGSHSPDTTLVLLPGERHHRELIFAPERVPAAERWTGRIPSTDEVTRTSGVAQVVASRRFDSFVDALMQGGGWGEPSTYGYYAQPGMPSFLAAMHAARAEVWLVLSERSSGTSLTREQQFAEILKRRFPEVRIRDATPLLVAMREIKSPAEQALLQRAIDITVEAQKAAMRRVLTAARESQVQATIEFTFRDLGACCWAFPSIVAAGGNATTLHYQSNDDPIARGGLLLTDIGAEVDGYAADVTRTYPADGRFSAEQAAIYDIVLAAQNQALSVARAGGWWADLHAKAVDTIGAGLLRLGLIAENTRDQVGLYMFHGAGHPLGLQTHDVFDRTRAFEPGMVITIEPGIYVRRDDVLGSEIYRKLAPSGQDAIRAALARYDGIGVRIEDDVLITSDQPKILSANAPRTRTEIEHVQAATQK